MALHTCFVVVSGFVEMSTLEPPFSNPGRSWGRGLSIFLCFSEFDSSFKVVKTHNHASQLAVK